MKSIAYPYPNLFPYIEKKSLWKYSLLENELKEFNLPVKGWDYNASLKVSCHLSWDPKKIFFRANLDELMISSKISFIAISGAGKYGITRKKVAEFSLIELSNSNNEMFFEIESPNQSNNIKFRLVVHTDVDSLKVNNFTYKKGSILYDEYVNLDLEGNLARISLQSIKFEEKFKNAMWYVDFKADSLYENFNSTHTLYLNSLKKNLEDELSKSIFLKDAIKVDIVYTILSSILLNEDLTFDLNEDYDDNTLGFQVKDWLKGLEVNDKSELGLITNDLKNTPGNLRRSIQEIFCTNLIED